MKGENHWGEKKELLQHPVLCTGAWRKEGELFRRIKRGGTAEDEWEGKKGQERGGEGCASAGSTCSAGNRANKKERGESVYFSSDRGVRITGLQEGGSPEKKKLMRGGRSELLS